MHDAVVRKILIGLLLLAVVVVSGRCSVVGLRLLDKRSLCILSFKPFLFFGHSHHFLVEASPHLIL